ncbi:MAG: lipase maturation factor family protein, partial [Elusimicrobia bacterium]|nr:lipase maturation factor family protein [Elusimicrobiota bacterium]
RPAEARWRRRLAAAFACFAVPTGLAAGLARGWEPAAESALVRSLASAGSTFSLVDAYGLFAVMTTVRREIVVEGSDDGRTWKEYGFPYKPGDPYRRPGWVEPFQPRLDWQMWFGALAPFQQNPWYLAFARRLLQGSPPVRALLSDDPFPDKPPKYVRSLFYEYAFTDPGEKGWWRRKLLGLYAPVLTLGPDGRLTALMPPR